MRADEIPVAYTPEGGWHGEMPPPILAACTEPLADGAIDLRGTWRLIDVEWKLGAPDPNPLDGYVERIEQCGNRVVVTSRGIIHDMRADGTLENGVHDVNAVGGQEIHVRCSFEDGVHVLRPEGMPGVEVTRRLDGDHLVWSYGPMFTARLARIP